MKTKTKTRPALFEIKRDFEEHNRRRVYRITEPKDAYVIDACGGRNPAWSRYPVGAYIISNFHREGYRTETCGMSKHGNATHYRNCATLEEAERHIHRWATRRWRVTVEAQGGAK